MNKEQAHRNYTIKDIIQNHITSDCFCFKGCPSTQYGALCERTCPAKCRGPCDLDTGRCFFGCANGWIGEICDQGIEITYIVFLYVVKCLKFEFILNYVSVNQKYRREEYFNYNFMYITNTISNHIAIHI